MTYGYHEEQRKQKDEKQDKPIILADMQYRQRKEQQITAKEYE